MFGLIKSLWKDESGQALVEYGLVIGLVAVALVTAVALFKDQIAALFTRLGTQLGNVAK